MTRKKPYFEGWYFKQQGSDGVLSLIVGKAVGPKQENAFLQVLTPQLARYIPYPISDYYADEDGPFIRLGNSYFTQSGILLEHREPGFSLTGELTFGALRPISGDIMGAFAHLPGMECYHGIQSIRHTLHGKVLLNDRCLNFDEGRGYLESDRGHSFPKRYLWLHCNDFSFPDCSLTAAVAEMAYGGIQFTGCIIHLYFNNKEYCFATYYGIRIVKNRKNHLIVEQGPYRLELRYHADHFGKLTAPTGGEMGRTVYESVSGTIDLHFYKDDVLVMHTRGRHAGVEYASSTPAKPPASL